MANVSGSPGPSDFFKAEGSAMLSAAKDAAGGAVGAAKAAGKKIQCIWTANQASGCPQPTPNEQSDAREVVEKSLLGRTLQDGFLNSKNHRKLMETGNVEGIDEK